jgi:cytidylate kinase
MPMTAVKEPVKMTSLLERQGSLLELRRRLAEEGRHDPRAGPGHLEQGPWVTLSKALGADWEGVARRLSDRLHWPLFDREILEEMSRESHVRETLLSFLDEHEVSWFEEALAHYAIPDRPAQHAFLDQMARVILALGHRGRAILVGRGANWLLDPAFGLRVRLVAPLPSRIARLVSEKRLTQAQARERIREDDAIRSRFIRQVYRQEIDDPAGYDLIMNVASLQPDATAECIIAALRRKLGEDATREI